MKVIQGDLSQQGTLKFTREGIEVIPSLWSAIPEDRKEEFQDLACKVRADYEVTVQAMKRKNPLLFNFSAIKAKIMEETFRDFLIDTGIIKIRERVRKRSSKEAIIQIKDKVADKFSLKTFLNTAYIDRAFFESLTDNQQDSFMILVKTMMVEYEKEIKKTKAINPNKKSFNYEKKLIKDRFFIPWLKDNKLVEQTASLKTYDERSSIKLEVTEEMEDVISLTVKKYVPIKIKKAIYEQIPEDKKEEFEAKVSDCIVEYTRLVKAQKEAGAKNFIADKKEVLEKIFLPYLDSIGVSYEYRYCACDGRKTRTFKEFSYFKAKTHRIEVNEDMEKDTKKEKKLERIEESEKDKIIEESKVVLLKEMQQLLEVKEETKKEDDDNKDIIKEVFTPMENAVEFLSSLSVAPTEEIKPVEKVETKKRVSYDIANELSMLDEIKCVSFDSEYPTELDEDAVVVIDDKLDWE